MMTGTCRRPGVRPFLSAIAHEPWRVGWSDCVGAMVRWIEAETGRRATLLLPVAGDEAEAAARLAEGGLLACMTHGLDALGLVRTDRPQAGDVAHLRVVAGLLAGQESAAIHDGRHWLTISRQSRLLPIRPAWCDATAWRLPHGL